MPRVVKPKAGTAGAAAPGSGAKKAAAPKRNKLYAMPEKITEGTTLTDLSKTQWTIGASIGTGGFGEIYSACRAGEKSYNYVVKCEPHGNGPLFVEMHFYMRNAKLEDIKRFQREHGLKSLGMPYMIGNGSVDLNGIKHRFIVMPRYGSDIAKQLLANGKRLPEGTVCRLAIQMLDVYEFIHSCGYVHADLKAANILLGFGKEDNAQAYLVDYGLASHYTTKEFKPDPKKMHNGTIEYTSRDAHLGVPTMRADFEILGYNLIEWSGGQLPWVKDKLLTVPTKVQKSKEDFMADISNALKNSYVKGVPDPIAEYMKYVAKLEYNEKPDYERCRKIFNNALKTMKISNSGELQFTMKNSNKNPTPSTSKARSNLLGKRHATTMDTSVELCASDDDDDDVIFEEKIPVKKAPQKTLKTIAKRSPKAAISPAKIKPKMSPTRRVSPTKRKVPTPKQRKVDTPTQRKAVTPTQRKAATPILPAKTTSSRKRRSSSYSPMKATHNSPVQEQAKPTPRSASKTTKSSSTPNASSSSTTHTTTKRSTPLAARANINFSPAISLSATRPGKTIINDNTTPVPRTAKTYEFNFELDVSMDANVVVNVKRKRKAPTTTSTGTPSSVNLGQSSSKSTRSSNGYGTSEKSDTGTPVTRVKVQKLASDEASERLRTPGVTVKKSRRIVS